MNDMHGEGVYHWPDGRSYKGNFKNDKKNGYGVYKYPDGRSYKGSFKDGLQHGIGVFVSPEGSERQGEWHKGKRIKWIDQREQLTKYNTINKRDTS